MSRLTRTTLLLAVFFALDKGLAFLRQIIIARQFGLSPELDAFNAANNVPDLLFALISGGALAMAFIPVLTEVLTREGRSSAWDLFSRIANLAFLVTGVLAIVVAVLAEPMVRSQVGIAPGFKASQQELVVELMRLNLAATLIFSISGLVMAGLQANQHFLLPAIAPLLYNVGQIFGALILSPEKGISLGGVTLPAFGMGIQGLVFGVIIGAVLHLAIQIPGLIRYQFHWKFGLGLNTPDVRKVLRLMGPRLVTMLFIQLIFLVRDNLASRLAAGAVTSLTYGWMIMQVPETLIGTAIGTAMLPTLAEDFSKGDLNSFRGTLERAMSVLIALTLPAAIVMSMGLKPFLNLAFGFDVAGTDLLLWVSRGYLLGLTGQCLMEVLARSFYARQEALTPLLTAGINLVVYVCLGSLLYQPLGAAGISLTDSTAFTLQAVILLVLLSKRLKTRFVLSPSLLRALLASVVGGGLAFFIMQIPGEGQKMSLLIATGAMAAGVLVAIPFIWKEFRSLVRL